LFPTSARALANPKATTWNVKMDGRFRWTEGWARERTQRERQRFSISNIPFALQLPQ
jgi:hypothetical protein